MITETLENHAIPLAHRRAQGYDDVASMSGKYNGAPAMMKEQYPILFIYLFYLYIYPPDSRESDGGSNI